MYAHVYRNVSINVHEYVRLKCVLDKVVESQRGAAEELKRQGGASHVLVQRCLGRGSKVPWARLKGALGEAQTDANV